MYIALDITEYLASGYLPKSVLSLPFKLILIAYPLWTLQPVCESCPCESDDKIDGHITAHQSVHPSLISSDAKTQWGEFSVCVGAEPNTSTELALPNSQVGRAAENITNFSLNNSWLAFAVIVFSRSQAFLPFSSLMWEKSVIGGSRDWWGCFAVLSDLN